MTRIFFADNWLSNLIHWKKDFLDYIIWSINAGDLFWIWMYIGNLRKIIKLLLIFNIFIKAQSTCQTKRDFTTICSAWKETHIQRPNQWQWGSAWLSCLSSTTMLPGRRSVNSFFVMNLLYTVAQMANKFQNYRAGLGLASETTIYKKYENASLAKVIFQCYSICCI